MAHGNRIGTFLCLCCNTRFDLPHPQGNTLSVTVHRGSAGGTGISLQAVGSTARLLVPDVPICGASLPGVG